MKPHIHSELIKLWADGAEIEDFNHSKGVWEQCIYPMWMQEGLYRVKKEKKKYRVAKLMDDNGGIYTSTWDPHRVMAGDVQFTKWTHFVKWLTGWIEYE